MNSFFICITALSRLLSVLSLRSAFVVKIITNQTKTPACDYPSQGVGEKEREETFPGIFIGNRICKHILKPGDIMRNFLESVKTKKVITEGGV